MNHLNKFRSLISAAILPFLLYSGIFISWNISYNSGTNRYINEAAFTEQAVNISTGVFSAGEKKNPVRSEQITQTFILLQQTDIIKSASYKKTFDKISFIELRLFPFLTSHFATST